MIYFINFILCLALPSAFAADKYFSFLGGGGEPIGKSTIFDPEIPFVGKYARSGDLKEINISFNGGHSNTEKKLDEAFKHKHTSFTEESYTKILNSYISKIKSGKIKSGDQVVIYLSTHGARKTPEEKTHQIAFSGKDATGDLSDLAEGELGSLDSLETLTQLALTHNIKLGIIDNSCHSGNTLALANKNTCVVSSSGSDLFGFASTAFAENLKKGKSLEDYFLKARKRFPEAFGLISSPAGIYTQDQIYPKIEKYLKFDSKRQSLSKFSESLDLDEKRICEVRSAERKNYNELIGYIDEIEGFVGPKKLLEKLESSIDKYHSFRQELLSSLEEKEKVKEQYVGKTYNLCEQVEGEERCSRVSVVDALSFNDKQLTQQEDILKEKPNSRFAKTLIDLYEKYKKVQKLLFAENPNLKEAAKVLQHQIDYDQTFSLAKKVGESTKKIYEEIYDSYKESEGESNPCGDIKL